MDTNHYYTRTTVPNNRRRRRRRRNGILPVVTLSVVLAVLTGLAVRISVFGKILNVEGGLNSDNGTVSTLQLPEMVEINHLTLPFDTVIEASELVSGLEGTNIEVHLSDIMTEIQPEYIPANYDPIYDLDIYFLLKDEPRLRARFMGPYQYEENWYVSSYGTKDYPGKDYLLSDEFVAQLKASGIINE